MNGLRRRAKMQIFVTGANGFIGGAVASALIADGHTVRGLVRSQAKGDAVAACGVEAVVGSLDDAALLQAEARAADAVINAASSDHRGAVEALIAGLSGSGKPLIHSSGSSIVADLAIGEPSDRIFHEATPIEPHADKAARVAIDGRVLAASGIRPVVLCNTMIYGNALGAPAESVQIPALVRLRRPILARRAGHRGLGPRHGGVLPRLEQPSARQGRSRTRLVAGASFGHVLDRRRARLIRLEQRHQARAAMGRRDDSVGITGL